MPVQSELLLRKVILVVGAGSSLEGKRWEAGDLSAKIDREPAVHTVGGSQWGIVDQVEVGEQRGEHFTDLNRNLGLETSKF